MRKFSLSALVVAGLLTSGLSAGSASAADLGGNCCADLEERIAELEATTARKGNRKVSLTVSGWVAEQALWWDDGGEQNVYVTGLGSTLATNVKFTGQATIAPGYSAGYVIHIEAMDSDSLTINQFSEHNPSALQPNNFSSGAYAVQLLQSFWFIKSDHLGKVGLGLQSSPSDNAAILVDGSGSLVPANWVMFDYNAFLLRNGATGGLTGGIWQFMGGFCRGGGGAGGDCFGAPRDSVRYDSPTFHGFSVSAGWGEDDFWDVAARYSGEHHGFKLAAAAAYSQWSSDFFTEPGLVDTGIVLAFPLTVPGVLPVSNQFSNDWNDYFQLGAYVEHVATGLWLYGAYGHISPSGVTAGTDVHRQSGYRCRRLRGRVRTERRATPTTSRVVSASVGTRWATRSSTASSPNIMTACRTSSPTSDFSRAPRSGVSVSCRRSTRLPCPSGSSTVTSTPISKALVATLVRLPSLPAVAAAWTTSNTWASAA